MRSSSRARSSAPWSPLVVLVAESLRGHVDVGEVLLAQCRGVRQLAQGQAPGGDDAEHDGGREVEHHGGEEGQGEHERVAARDPHQGAQARHLDHPHRGGDEHPGQRGERDPADDGREREHDDEQHDRVDDRGQPRACPGPDVDRGAGDRGRGRDAAEQRGGEVGQALPEQLAVGVVAGRDAHRVGDGGRQQALQRRQGRHGDGRHHEHAQLAPADRRHAEGEQARRAAHRSSPRAGRPAASPPWPPRRPAGRPARRDAAGSPAGSPRPRRHSAPGRRGPGRRTSRARRRPRRRRRARAAPVVPRAAGTCWRAISAAMPRVNPSMTGSGMKRT